MTQPLFILTIIAGYFAVWLLVSWLSSKGADNSTFFSGNRKMAWPLVAVAMLGAPISGVTFISVPGMVATKGYSYIQMALGFIVGYIIISYILIPLYYKLNIISIYQFLQRRFGRTSYKTGAWLFLISKIFGISIRFLTVCAILQFLVLDPLGIPFFFSVLLSITFVWLSTVRGGVKSVIWGDILKSFCLLTSIILCIWVILKGMDFSVLEFTGKISEHYSSRIFHFDDPMDSKYFWKQFVAGIVVVVAMTGLDQDMMQRTLTCRDSLASRKNMITGSLLQFVTILLLLILGTVMALYLEGEGEPLPNKSDNLFATVAFHKGIPLIVGILFILGLVSATYSSVASALTSMTTTFTVDILEANCRQEGKFLKRKRILIHSAIALSTCIMVSAFYYLNEEDAISTVYTLVSYTDGPILGLFLFGIITDRQINEKWLPAVCLMAPAISWMVQWSVENVTGYQISYELIILNAGLTYAGLQLVSSPARRIDLVPPVSEP